MATHSTCFQPERVPERFPGRSAPAICSFFSIRKARIGIAEERAMYREHYGTTEDGQNVEVYTLSNKAGLTARILTFGGVIASLEVPDRQGRTANVVLGLDSLAGYAHRSPHFGALTGRYANRIAHGRFTLDGVEYRLP